MRWGRVAGFLLVGLVMHLVASAAYVFLLQGHKAIRIDRAFVARAPRHLTVLVGGDSHPRTAIDASQLGDRAFNVALGGEHYLKTYYRLRALIDGTHRTVGTVVLPLDASSFSSWEAWNFAPEYVWGRYVDFAEVGRVRGDFWGYFARELKAEAFPYAGELRTFAQMRGNRFGFGDDLPTNVFSELSLEEQRQAALDQATLHFKGSDLMDPGLRWALDRIVQWTEDRRIRLVLVAFPVTSEYWGWLEATGVDHRVQDEVVTPLLRDHPRVLRLDYHDRWFGRNELFADPHHLNTEGRAAFTAMLRADLAAQGIVTPAPTPAPSGETEPPAP